MSNFFGGKTSNYEKVTQDSDTDFSDTDQETVIFRKPGEIELNLYPTSKEKVKAKTSCVNVCVCLSLVVVVAVFGGVAVYFYLRHETVPEVEVQHVPHRPINTSLSKEWQLTLEEAGGEGGLSFVDVDGDGIDDIIFGTTVASLIDDVMQYPVNTFESVGQFCKEKGRDYPCLGHIVAIRGIDHTELWRIAIRSEVFIVDCSTFDFNSDGKVDCIGTGRQGIVIAFDPYTGKQLWVCEDDAFIKGNWNTYGVTAIPDLDKDGVPEVLLPNGGDPKYAAEFHDRPAGRLVLLSGATGLPLGSRVLEMPDKHETYMSALLYTPRDGSQPYVLFGSGGETVPGNLYGINLADLCHFFLDVPAQLNCPSHDDNDTWDFLNKDIHGIAVIYKGEKKGVMVPPVIVEMTGDDVDDLVVSVYDGAIILFDGQTLQQVWTANFPGMESYSTPAPGYFDDDDILDFMMHWCVGAWMDYTGSNVSVINGKDGSIMWTLDSARMQMSSNLVLSTSVPHKDLFLYRLLGRGSNFRWDANGTITNSDDKETSHQRKRRHGDEGKDIEKIHEDLEKFNKSDKEELDKEFEAVLHSWELTCDEDLSRHNDEVFIMNRDMLYNPIRVLKLPMRRLYYDPLPPKPDHDDDEEEEDASKGLTHGGGKQRRHSNGEKLCSVARPDARTTGGIADVDGDGQLDYISLLTYSIQKTSEDYNYEFSTYTTVVTKVDLGVGLMGDVFETVPVQAETTMTVEGASTVDQQALADSILPPEQQKWLEYMGRDRNSIYY